MSIVCGLFSVPGLFAASQYQGLARWVLLGAGCVWGSIVITSWLILLSPFGWFGTLGRWVDRFMQDDWPQQD